MSKVYVKLRDKGSLWNCQSQGKVVVSDRIEELEETAEVGEAIRGNAIIRVDEADFKKQQTAMGKAFDKATADDKLSAEELAAKTAAANEAGAKAAEEADKKAKEKAEKEKKEADDLALKQASKDSTPKTDPNPAK